MMMMTPTRMRLCLVLILTLLLSGCDPDDPTGPPPGTATGDASALLPLSFYHIEDSDGGKPGAGVDVVMVFEPNGIADIYTARATEAIAYKGTYSMKDGKITLKFNGADLKADATFTIDTSQATATMPFKAFSAGAGSSRWRRERKSIPHNLHVIFNAATLAENLPADRAIERVTAYANAMVEIDRLGKRAMGKRGIFDDPKLTGVKPFLNGVQLQYDEGPYTDVLLYSWGVNRTSPLSLSPLASDPRVHLDPEPENGASDPIEKRALFIAPFDGKRESVTWYDFEFFNKKVSIPADQTVEKGWARWYDLEECAKPLEKRGYNVKMLKDDEANVVNIIESLLPGNEGRAHTPGFVTMITHGLGTGNLLTGTILGDDGTWRAAYDAEIAKIKAAGYGDLLTYDGGTEDNPKTLVVTSHVESMRSGAGWVRILTVTPKFWEWLRKSRGADFSRSLVFISACYTNILSDLRRAFQSRAYFTFNVSVYVAYASKVFEYFCKSLARPTHSAEETYYNVIRVMNTRQMIYAEDKILDRYMPAKVEAQADSAGANFQGYGFNGAEIVSYWHEGWLHTSNVDPGGLWWLLFAGRWSKSASEGALGLKGCWDQFYSKGKLPGLADPGCQNKAPGRVPTANEIAYATYLLNGEYAIPSSAPKIQRWTLNDGR